MPAFVDWNSLLFGSSPEVASRDRGASHPELDASPPEGPGSSDAPSAGVVANTAFPAEQGEPETESESESESVKERKGREENWRTESESAVPAIAIPESGILESAVPESIAPPSTVPHRLLHWNPVPESANDRFTVGAILVGTLLFWLWTGRRRRSSAASRRSADGDEVLSATKKDFTQRTEALESKLDQVLKRQAEVLEERFQQVLSEQSDAVEEHVRKSLNKRVETLEVRIKLDQAALNDVHRALSERMEAFEGFVRTIDSKNLDQEANSIAQLTLSQRLDAVEEGFRNVENKARSSSQRIEALDDSVRVIDSRAKALSQRVEAAEDNLNTTDAQVTLLTHDVTRGSSVIEKLQRQVKMLPDAEKFKGLSRTWEAKVKKLEAKLEETEKALEEHLAEPPPVLTWSHIESIEIEPSGPLYTRPYALSFDGSVISPSSSVRSYSTNDSHARTYSTISSSPATPMTPERRRIDTAGFRETTFSSRQKFLAHRTDSWSG
ncbi:putative s-layer protein [Rosellinia necatrix]|uniref:Putative s-layer protein n=1 Tax=Rosellinia necatrix TaxID=77044 RepID=A0A1W2TID5_ROSNE|nr:putative s-layer protein [Rosellinia necatrix]